MDSSSWWSALGPIIAFCAVGAFIDFYIGQAGQKRVKGWLETWWLKLSYVRWGNFGREEALFAVQAIDRLFGRRLFSLRRLLAVLVIALISIAISLIIRAPPSEFYHLYFGAFKLVIEELWVFYILDLVSLGISFSVTRIASNKVAHNLSNNAIINLFMFISIVLLQYFILAYWWMFDDTLQSIFLVTLRLITDLAESPAQYADTFSKYLADFPSMWRYIAEREFSPNYLHDILIKFPLAKIDDYISRFTASMPPITTVSFMDLSTEQFVSLDSSSLFGAVHYQINGIPLNEVYFNDISLKLEGALILFPNLVRLLIAVIFILSILLQPLQGPISRLWAGVVESDKPVFTLVFGALGTFIKIVQEIAKIL